MNQHFLRCSAWLRSAGLTLTWWIQHQGGQPWKIQRWAWWEVVNELPICDSRREWHPLVILSFGWIIPCAGIGISDIQRPYGQQGAIDRAVLVPMLGMSKSACRVSIGWKHKELDSQHRKASRWLSGYDCLLRAICRQRHFFLMHCIRKALTGKLYTTKLSAFLPFNTFMDSLQRMCTIVKAENEPSLKEPSTINCHSAAL